jgi:cysteine-S-conjugate beta-lyase
MGEICLKHGVPVISDEIHCEIVMPGYGYTPMASISPEFRDNTITMCSPSKAFNLAGLQIANIITSRADWREKINRALNLNEVCDVNAFGVEALTSAYTEPEARVWLDELNTYISGNYEYLKDFFAKELPWLPVSVLEGTYLVWCDCRSLGLSSDEIEKTLVERFNVHINAGRMYGEAGEGFIRINLATPRSIASEGLSRIAAGLKALRP